jgi:hypothetical protein
VEIRDGGGSLSWDRGVMSTHPNFDADNAPASTEPILIAAVVFVVTILVIVTALIAAAS